MTEEGVEPSRLLRHQLLKLGRLPFRHSFGDLRSRLFRFTKQQVGVYGIEPLIHKGKRVTASLVSHNISTPKVPEARVELASQLRHWYLKPACLPFHHSGIYFPFIKRRARESNPLSIAARLVSNQIPYRSDTLRKNSGP